MKRVTTMMLAGLVAVAGLGVLAAKDAPSQHGKFLVILQAGKESHEGMARAVHALLYARELKDHGHEVVLVFDGAGTEWVEEWTKSDTTNKLAPMYQQLSKAGITQVSCDFCAGAF